MSVGGLQQLLSAANTSDGISEAAFEQVVFGSQGQIANILASPASLINPGSAVGPREFMNSAIAVLAEAARVNADEETVLRWFNHGRPQIFDGMTPAEAIASGHGSSLLEYVASLDAGWVG